MINLIIAYHFNQTPTFIRRITIGICNEVYRVGLADKEVIVRLNSEAKFLMGSHDHIPKFKLLNIKVPDILAEDYSNTRIPFCYQIQNKIEGEDLGNVIENLTDRQLKLLAKEVAIIFNKVKTIPTNGQYGVIWGGGDNDISSSWTERMKIWIEESLQRGKKTEIMDDELSIVADQLYIKYKPYFDSVKPVTYYGDICSKNIMMLDGHFNGLVDLDGLTQGDPLEAIGRIKLSWYGTNYGKIYTDAIMDMLSLTDAERKLVTMYALLNQISWTCENGIQFNQNTKPIVNEEKKHKDKVLIQHLINEI